MKHLKLFFALFAMLALGVSNAWAEEVTFSGDDIRASFNYGNNYKEGTFTSDGFSIYCSSGYGNTSAQFRVAKSATLTINSTVGNITKVVITVTDTSYKLNDNNISWSSTTGTYSNAGGVQEITFTNSNENIARISKIAITYEPSSAGGGETPDPTTYTIKWHTAKGVTTDVVLNEGTAITKLATDPTMNGYEFMGWTEDCAVASDGSGFTAISNFGTATEDKDYYAVFAVATTTSGEGSSNYEKVTSNLTDWAGDYLIAYNNTTFADGRTGGTSGMGAQNKKVDLSSNISNNTIPASVGDQYNVTLEAVTGGYVLKTKEGKYNYQSTNANGLATTTSISTASQYAIKVTFTSENDIKLALSGGANGAVFRYNTSGYFRFYKNGGQSAVYLYKKVAGGSTTTYSDYITTCASDIEFVELGDAFKWSAIEAEVTIDATDNVFPTLTNTHNVPVTYSSSDDAIATIADGTVTLKKEGTVTITAKYEGGTSAGTGKEYKAKSVTYSLKVNKAAPVASGTTYVKVTSTAGITDGEYLIVYEAGNVAFDGSLTTLDAEGNTIEVTINDNTIAGTNYIDAATFTIDVTNGTILSASGKYIGKTANSNGLDVKTTAMTNTFAIDANGNAVITGNTAALRYNKTADQKRFRYYKDGGGSQEKIQLYKKASKHTVTIATCTYGSVNAKMGETALATNDQVLSGTQITLGNEAATNYKLAAYDVYKTDDATTKVTVTDGKFIMPEFDVTISATFELAKTLTGIEITTPATQTTFWQGEEFNHDGLKVTAHFDGAEDEDVTSKITVTGSTATAGAAVEVAVSYNEGATTKTATYNITVKAIPNSKETAYTVTDAFDIIDKLTTANGVFIKGIVSQVDSYNETYKSITYWISADGTTTNQLQVYSGKGLESADFSGKTDLSVGDQVIVCGNLKKYNETYEFDKNNYLASHTPTTKDPAGLAYATTSYTANVGEAFTTPELTNPHNLDVTYSTSDASKATVDANGAVTIVAAGVVTITAATTGDATHDAGSASYTITITDLSLLIATLPFEFNGKQADIEGTAGMTQSGIDSKDYADAPYLKMNTTGDWLIIRFDSEPGKLSYDIKNNSFSGGTFSVQESADGETYTDVAVHTEITETQSEEHTLSSTSRYVKFIYTEKVNGNVGLGNIKITEPDNRADAGLAWNPTSVTLTQGEALTAPTLNNPNSVSDISYESSNDEVATVTAEGEIALGSATGTATITATFAGDANYKPATATCTINVTPVPDNCEGSDDFETDESENPLSYVERTTEAGWKATNAAKTTIEGYTYLIINGKTSAVGTITSPTLNDGIGSIKIRYANTYSETNGVSFRLDIKQNDEVVKTYTITKAKAEVVQNTVYTELIENINVEGDFQMVFTNLSPSNDTDNKDRVSIGRLCWTGYTAPVIPTPDYTRATTAGKFGTICLPFGSTNYTGAEFFEFVGSETGKVYIGSVDELVAGVPYIFLASAAKVVVTSDGTTAATPGNSNGLYGTFTNDTEVAANDDNHILLNNELRKVTETCWVNANRAYIVMSEVPTGAPTQMPGRRYIGMGVEGENEATGFENITNGENTTIKVIENGQLIIIRNGVKYNVQGIKL